MRECGEVVQACRAGVLTSGNIVPMAEVVAGCAGHDMDVGPVLFKGSGMAWEDLVVAQSIVGTA
jgi:ornithine cyclodeaminase/alanine dehydrogenase-like protein (mu-crystallin family)